MAALGLLEFDVRAMKEAACALPGKPTRTRSDVNRLAFQVRTRAYLLLHLNVTFQCCGTGYRNA
jgi:hypothetical protein